MQLVTALFIFIQKGGITDMKKKWNDLSQKQKAGIGIASLLQFILLAAALADIYRRNENQIRGSKYMWAALSFINFIGPIAYFILGRKKTTQCG